MNFSNCLNLDSYMGAGPSEEPRSLAGCCLESALPKPADREPTEFKISASLTDADCGSPHSNNKLMCLTEGVGLSRRD